MADGVYAAGNTRGDSKLYSEPDENHGYVVPGSEPHEQIDWVNGG
jgi:hypothetical protein